MVAHHMGAARLNFSWGTYDEHANYIKLVREAAHAAKRHIPVIQDLSGPREQEKHGHKFDVRSTVVITKKDERDLAFGMEQNVDYVAMSFVGGPREIVQLRKMVNNLGRKTPIIAKIERRVALTKLREIIHVSDAIMIARGDLGNEIPLEKIPWTEKMIIGMCKEAHKPVITATQMLLSMTENKLPTRAEVTDVFFAIANGSDAVMLSEESANGKYPIEAVSMMERITTEASRHYKGEINRL
jgi:pyruvate kinase